jgi:hypothetical protein
MGRARHGPAYRGAPESLWARRRFNDLLSLVVVEEFAQVMGESQVVIGSVLRASGAGERRSWAVDDDDIAGALTEPVHYDGPAGHRRVRAAR